MSIITPFFQPLAAPSIPYGSLAVFDTVGFSALALYDATRDTSSKVVGVVVDVHCPVIQAQFGSNIAFASSHPIHGFKMVYIAVSHCFVFLLKSHAAFAPSTWDKIPDVPHGTFAPDADHYLYFIP